MLKPCLHPGCPEAAHYRGRCKEHAKENEKAQPDHSHMYTYKWSKASAAYRKKYPLCVVCEAEGKTVLGDCVDHIIPHRGDKKLFWNFKSNVQVLCNTHHSEKTWRETHGQ